MKELAGKVQIVINTIQDLDIKSTFSNMNRLMGAMKTLAGIRDALEKMGNAEVVELFTNGENVAEDRNGENVAEDRNDGNADAE